MTSKQMAAVVLKTLRVAHKNRPSSLEVLADMIVGDIETFDELLGMGGVVISTPAPEVRSDLILVSAPGAVHDLAAGPGAFSRIGAPAAPEVYSDAEMSEMKTKAVLDYRATLPKSIEITPAGFAAPIKLLQHTIGGAPGSTPCVTICYVPPGAQSEAELVRVVKEVTRGVPSAAVIVEEIIAMACTMFSAAPRKVASRFTQMNGGESDLFANAISVGDNPHERLSSDDIKTMQEMKEKYSVPPRGSLPI